MFLTWRLPCLKPDASHHRRAKPWAHSSRLICSLKVAGQGIQIVLS